MVRPTFEFIISRRRIQREAFGLVSCAKSRCSRKFKWLYFSNLYGVVALFFTRLHKYTEYYYNPDIHVQLMPIQYYLKNLILSTIIYIH